MLSCSHFNESSNPQSDCSLTPLLAPISLLTLLLAPGICLLQPNSRTLGMSIFVQTDCEFIMLSDSNCSQKGCVAPFQLQKHRTKTEPRPRELGSPHLSHHDHCTFLNHFLQVLIITAVLNSLVRGVRGPTSASTAGLPNFCLICHWASFMPPKRGRKPWRHPGVLFCVLSLNYLLSHFCWTSLLLCWEWEGLFAIQVEASHVHFQCCDSCVINSWGHKT